MRRVDQTIEVYADPDEVWALAGDPARIAELGTRLAGATAQGDRRSCTTQDGATIEVRILERSAGERHCAYEIIEAPFPVRSFRSALSVHGHGDHSHVDWEAEFEPECPDAGPELAATFGEIYRRGLESLRERFEPGEAA